MKPIAVDLGKAYWVIARTDESGQPTVAGLGDGGLIPALVTEYEGQLMVGQQIEPIEGVPYLRDCYHWVLGGPEIRSELGQFMRDGAGGEVEVYMAGQWWSASALLTRMFRDTTQVVKDYLAPNSSLPVVAAVPPDIDRRLLEIYRKSMEDAGLLLSGWCPTPLALAFGDTELLHREHAIAATLNIDWGFLTLGIVEVRDGFPQLRVSRNLEWSWQQWGQQLPLEQVGMIADQVMNMAQDYWGIEPSAIDRLLIGGEEAWIHQLYSVLQERIPATFTPFHQPRLAISMGTALFAEMLHEGLALAPVQSPTASTQVSLTGFAIPEAQIDVRGGAQDESFRVDLNGIVEHPVTLIPEQTNQLSISVRAGDGRHFAMFLNVEHRSDVVVDGSSNSALKSYAGGEAETPTPASALPGWSGSSHTHLDGADEALLIEPGDIGEASLLMEDVGVEETGESTAEDLGIPSKEKDAPKPIIENPGPAPLDEDLGDRTSMAPAPIQSSLLSSIGEGDGETRILTTDSYARLGIGQPGKEQEEPTGQEAGVEVVDDFDIIESIDDDSVEIIEEQQILSAVDEPSVELDDDEIDEAIGVLEAEKSIIEVMAISEEDEPSAPQTPAPIPTPQPLSEPELEVVLTAQSLDDAPAEEESALASAPPSTSAASPSLQEQAAALAEKQEQNRRSQLGLTPSPESQAVSPQRAEHEPVEEQDEESFSAELAVFSSAPELDAAEANGSSESNAAHPNMSEMVTPVPASAAAPGEMALDTESIMQKISAARKLAKEAYAMMEESRTMVEDLESMLGPSVFALIWEQDENGLEDKPLELSVRREARKILELGKQLTEVEANRLPTSSRKTLQRLTKELEAQMQGDDGSIPIRLALQLANRLFETIRRDLRPW